MEDLNSLKPQITPLRNLPAAGAGKKRWSVEALKNGQAASFSLDSGEPASKEKQPPAGSQVNNQGRYIGRQTEKNLNKTSAGPANAEDLAKLKKIHKAATDYEEVFVKQMVDSMPQSSMAEAPGGDGFTDMAKQAFSGYLAQAGGLGLAEKITTQVARQEGLDEVLNQNPQILGPKAKIRIPASHRTKTMYSGGQGEGGALNIPAWDSQGLMSGIIDK